MNSRLWVAKHLGLTVDADEAAESLELGVAIRRNPKRSHLLVSPALAKHVPIAPATLRQAAKAMANRIRESVALSKESLCIGFAETATGFSLAVADELGPISYIHTTRATQPSSTDLTFSEPHSHAPEQILKVKSDDWLARRDVIVLIDDELTTGTTAINLVRSLRVRCPNTKFVIAALVDARVEESPGLDIQWVSLSKISLDIPSQILLLGEMYSEQSPPLSKECSFRNRVVLMEVPPSPREGLSVPNLKLYSFAENLVKCIGATVGETPVETVHIVGIEEQIYLPVILAEEIQRSLESVEVLVSSSTRSPIVAMEVGGYPINSAIVYKGVDGLRYLYNAPPSDITVIVPDTTSLSILESNDLAKRIPNSTILVEWADA